MYKPEGLHCKGIGIIYNGNSLILGLYRVI